MATSDALVRQQITAYEPWVCQMLGLRGVSLTDLLEVARADSGAQVTHPSTLDGFQLDVSTAEITTGEFFVATQTRDGGPLPIVQSHLAVHGMESQDPDGRWAWSPSTVKWR